MGFLLNILWFLLLAAAAMTGAVGIYVGLHVALRCFEKRRYLKEKAKGREIVGM